MLRTMFSPIIRSTWLYLQYLVVSSQVAAGWCPEWVQTKFQLINLLFQVGSTCFGRCFRPSSGALDCIYNIWYCSPKLLPAGVPNELKLLIPSRLYMFGATFSSIIRSTWQYLQYLVVFSLVVAGWYPEWVETAYFKSALHVSGDVFAYHKEHLTVFTVSGSIHPRCCRLVSRMSWNCLFQVSSTCFGRCFRLS